MMIKTYSWIAASLLLLAPVGGCSTVEEGGGGSTGGNDDESGASGDSATVTLTATGPATTNGGSSSTTGAETDTTPPTSAGTDSDSDPTLTGSTTAATTGVDTGSSGSESGSGSTGTTGIAEIATIYEIQQGDIAEDEIVTVNDAIVTGVGAGSLFVQAAAGGEYSGISIFSGDGGPDLSGAALGDEILVTGRVAEFNSLTQIVVTEGSFEITATPGEGNVPAPETLLPADLDEPWECVFVRIEADTFSLTEINAMANNDEFTVMGAGADMTPVIVDDFLYAALTAGDFAGIDLGASFTAIQGPLNGFNMYKIAPRSAADFTGYAAP